MNSANLIVSGKIENLFSSALANSLPYGFAMTNSPATQFATSTGGMIFSFVI